MVNRGYGLWQPKKKESKPSTYKIICGDITLVVGSKTIDRKLVNTTTDWEYHIGFCWEMLASIENGQDEIIVHNKMFRQIIDILLPQES